MFRFVLVLMAILLLGGTASGQMLLGPIDCDYVSHGQFATPGADTLWFTSATPTEHSAAALQLADWYAPLMVPFASNSGELQTSKRRVKAIKFYSRVPFSLLIDHPVGKASIATYVTVDTTSSTVGGLASTAVGRYHGETFPCVKIVQGYPDSVKVKEAGSDTVWFDLGY